MGNFKMTLLFKIYCTTILFVLFSFFANGQKSDCIAAKLQLTVLKIDSICNFIDSNKNLAEGIAEGEFYNQKGGWETYDLKSNQGDTLFRIRHNSSTDHYYQTTFYYFDKDIIKGIVRIEDYNSKSPKKSVYSATYYIANNKTIKILNEDTKFSTALNIFKQGQNYQDNFYRNR